MAEGKTLKIIGLGVHTIDYATLGAIPALKEGEDLSITGPIRTHPGGIGNGVPVAAKLFPGRVGAATWLGDDANGHAFFDYMKKAGVDTGGIKWNTQLPRSSYEVDDQSGKTIRVPKEQLSTGMSFVCVDPQTRDRIIFFSPGINQAIGRENLDLDYLGTSEAVIISYSTLLRALDRERGMPMAGLIKDLRKRDVLTILDTHSIRGADYGVLENPLKEVDVFGCNIGEARSITGLGLDASPEALLTSLTGKMDVEGSRSRMVAMSMKEKGCALAYYPAGQKKPVMAVVPACSVEVKDATGAGDTFKVGLVAYILENREAFNKGSLNVREAGQFGNATAASYIRDVGTSGVRTYDGTLRFMREQYPQSMSPETVLPQSGVRRHAEKPKKPV
jgi:sugar/nucleoside kinase (ribokinase family)